MACIAQGSPFKQRSQDEMGLFAQYVTSITNSLALEVEEAVRCYERIYRVNNVMDFNCNSLLLDISNSLEKV